MDWIESSYKVVFEKELSDEEYKAVIKRIEDQCGATAYFESNTVIGIEWTPDAVEPDEIADAVGHSMEFEIEEYSRYEDYKRHCYEKQNTRVERMVEV